MYNSEPQLGARDSADNATIMESCPPSPPRKQGAGREVRSEKKAGKSEHGTHMLW